MILPQIQIARAHWVLGALFLAIVLEEYLPLIGRDGRPARSRSLVVPWALILGGVGAWATVVFADVVHDMLVTFCGGISCSPRARSSWPAAAVCTNARGSMMSYR